MGMKAVRAACVSAGPLLLEDAKQNMFNGSTGAEVRLVLRPLPAHIPGGCTPPAPGTLLGPPLTMGAQDSWCNR